MALRFSLFFLFVNRKTGYGLFVQDNLALLLVLPPFNWVTYNKQLFDVDCL